MSRHTLHLFRPCASRRGSVFVLVVSILAVLGLMAAVFSYSTRMELLASHNWADKVQANMATLTGVQTNLPTQAAGQEALDTAVAGQQTELAPVALQLTAKLGIDKQLARTTEQSKTLAKADRLAAKQYDVTSDYSGNPEALADFLVEDTSAKININAVLPVADKTSGEFLAPSPLTEQTLARLIDDVMTTAKINNIDATALAHAIVLYRYGLDERPGEAGVDDNGDSAMTTGLDDNKYDVARDGLQDASGELITRVNRDRLDNDRDGIIDEPDESIESDGLDNDYDGQIDETGEGIDNPGDALIDIRETPRGDDRPFVSLSQLINVKGMTPQACQALEPYLTVFSASRAAYAMPNAETATSGDGAQTELDGLPQVDPNTADAQTLYETLKTRLPQTDSKLIGQFVTNIIDRRDVDDIPSSVMLDGHEFLGMEMTPRFNEVCPDTSSLDEDGDDGQYIELFNPYSKSLSIEGWVIQGAGSPIRLSGSMPSGGYLVLTDDFNNENDPTPEWDPGQGSFFNIFNVIPTGAMKRLEEVTTLDLPNETGTVKLLDANSKLIDTFTWNKGTWTGAALSFQRIDPRVNTSEHVLATPLAPNVSFSTSGDAQNALEIQEKGQNKPFRCALDVMLVSSAHAASDVIDASQSQSADAPQSWALPVLRAGNSSALDLRLVDCFRTGAVVPEKDNANSLTDPAVITQDVSTGGDTATTTRATSAQAPCDTNFGLINLNTAPPAILAALPGMTAALAGEIYVARMSWLQPQQDASLFRSKSLNSQNPQWWIAVHPNAEPCWSNLSDFLLDDTLWQDRPLYDRLDAVYPFFRLLTAHSQSLRVVSVNRQPLQDATTGTQTVRPTWSRAERIITADRGSVETVTFRFLGQQNILRGDPDMLYAKEDPTAEKSYIDELKRLDPYLSSQASKAATGRKVSRQ